MTVVFIVTFERSITRVEFLIRERFLNQLHDLNSIVLQEMVPHFFATMSAKLT